VTNAESEEYRIVVGHVLAMLGNANSGVNRVTFISLATVPYIQYTVTITQVRKSVSDFNLELEF